MTRGKADDLTGMRFGKLLVIKLEEHGAGVHWKWRCRCDCGTEMVTRSSNLKCGRSTSCGCDKGLSREWLNKNQNSEFKDDIEDLKFRLMIKVNKTSSCWLWDDKKHNTWKYGLIKFRKSTIGAHRAAWIVHNGEIPKGMYVCHKCDNPLCVNPDHLFLGTAKDNINDMVEKHRENFQGHLKYQPKLVDAIVSLIKNGNSTLKVSKMLNMSKSQIYCILKQKRVAPDRKSLTRPTKVTQDNTKRAVELRAQGMKCKEIQEILGMSKRTLSRLFKTVAQN